MPVIAGSLVFGFSRTLHEAWREVFKQVQAVFPDQKPIDRTFSNSGEDRRVVEAMKNTGRKK